MDIWREALHLSCGSVFRNRNKRVWVTFGLMNDLLIKLTCHNFWCPCLFSSPALVFLKHYICPESAALPKFKETQVIIWVSVSFQLQRLCFTTVKGLDIDYQNVLSPSKKISKSSCSSPLSNNTAEGLCLTKPSHRVFRAHNILAHVWCNTLHRLSFQSLCGGGGGPQLSTRMRNAFFKCCPA